MFPPALSLSGVTHSNSERTDPSHSTEVQALSQASIVSVTAKSQEQGSGMSDGHRKRHRRQKLLGEFFGGREKRRRIEDPVSSPVAIMQKVVESKEKGRRRTSDWCCICMEEYEFMSIDEITGEKCCVKKTAKCRLCRAIYILWRKEKMRGKNQSGPSWTGVVRHLESEHNVRTEEEAKEAMHDKDRGLGGTPQRLILFRDTPSRGAQRAHGLKSV